MTLQSLVRALADRCTSLLVSTYFDVSYRLLASAGGRELLRAAAAADAAAVHGYTTSRDVDALFDAIRPSPSDVLMDLGCGMGDVAIEIHRRTGCRVVGVDGAPAAVAEARRRARAAGADPAVRFVVADLSSPPVRASAAYALDSLMFVPRPPEVICSLSRSIEPPGRIFVTFLDHRRLGRDAFARFIEAGGVRVERLEDVSAEFRQRNRQRAVAARRLLRDRPSWIGRLVGWLVLAEEAFVARLVRRGRLRRWRFIVAADASARGAYADGPRPFREHAHGDPAVADLWFRR